MTSSRILDMSTILDGVLDHDELFNRHAFQGEFEPSPAPPPADLIGFLCGDRPLMKFVETGGYAVCQKRGGQFVILDVAARRQQQGWFTEFLGRVEDACRQSGWISAVVVDTVVNPHLMRFLRRRGYEDRESRAFSRHYTLRLRQPRRIQPALAALRPARSDIDGL